MSNTNKNKLSGNTNETKNTEFTDSMKTATLEQQIAHVRELLANISKENMAQIVGFFDSLSEEQKTAYLDKTLSNLSKKGLSEFAELTKALPIRQKIIFAHILETSGLSVKDKELANLLSGLLVSTTLCETIPNSMKESEKAISQLKAEIEEVADDIVGSHVTIEALLDRAMDRAAPVNEALEKIHSHIEQATEKASRTVSDCFRKRLLDAMNQAMPLDDIEKSLKYIFAMADATKKTTAGMQTEIESMEKSVSGLQGKINETASAASDSLKKSGDELQTVVKETSDILRKNTKIIRWKQIGGHAITVASILLAMWVAFHFSYEIKLERDRLTVISQIEENRNILRALSKSNHNLELINVGGSKKRLVMSNAKSWATDGGWGVIEFKE